MKNEVRNKGKNFIENNSGSTLVTVIVAIAFITVLTSIILSTSILNMRMKGIDRHAKDDFYHAEKALNDIYTGIGQQMSVIAGEEYDKAFVKVGTSDSTIDYGLAEVSEKEFKVNFISEARKIFWDDTKSDDENNAALLTLLTSYITESGRSKVESVGNVVVEKKDGTVTTAPYTNPYRMKIKDLVVSSTDSEGYQSAVSTDIVIYIPSADFFGANVEVSDYGIIANKGIYFNGDANVTGNIYGGIHEKSESAYKTADEDMYDTTKAYDSANLYGGINIKDASVRINGNYIISKGNINLSGTGAKLKVGDSTITDANLPNIWFDSLRTLKGASNPSIELYSNTYALNDLELNADGSDVKISGNYYGYNDKTLPIENKKFLGQSDVRREDAESSAIIVNGSSCTLNMKDINTFVLMGKAYVDFQTNKGNVDMSVATARDIVATAEGVALKTNQQLYLVPIDFLNCANPIGGAEFEAAPYNGNFEISTSKEDLVKWFGYKYVVPNGVVVDFDNLNADINKQTDGDSGPNVYKNIYTPYKVTLLDETGTTDEVYYAYLNFNDRVWIPLVDSNNIITGIKEAPAGTQIGQGINESGTGAAISSKAAFFYEIMAATKPVTQAEIDAEDAKMQPSAYRLQERIGKSIKYSYFDLKNCIIGDKDNRDNTILYAQNAVVSYEDLGTGVMQSSLLGNTVGMARFASYPQNMYHRYQWLCTRLDGREDIPLKDDPGVPRNELNDFTDTTKQDKWEVSTSYAGADANDLPPLSHFVMIDKLNTYTNIEANYSIIVDAATAAGLSRTAYGDCIIGKGNFDITSSKCTVGGNTFKGIAIIDGDIIVEENINVDGLLMATGTITVKGNSTITYDKGLIQARIEKELQLVKQDTDTSDAAYKPYYLISYLSKTTRMPGNTASPSLRMYNAEAGSAQKNERIEADYNEFVQYENWEKGTRP